MVLSVTSPLPPLLHTQAFLWLSKQKAGQSSGCPSHWPGAHTPTDWVGDYGSGHSAYTPLSDVFCLELWFQGVVKLLETTTLSPAL